MTRTRRVRGARWLFLAMSVAILLAVALTGSMLARAVLRPIDRIVSRARVMGAKALAERLPRPAGRDEMSRLVDTLNEMLARIERVFEAQRRFTADASHELRSPLSRLRAELEVTLRRTRDPVEYQEALQSCLGEVERLGSLTEGLLTLARLEAGDAREAPMQSIPLTRVIDDVVTRLEPEARRREVALVVDAAGDPVGQDGAGRCGSRRRQRAGQCREVLAFRQPGQDPRGDAGRVSGDRRLGLRARGTARRGPAPLRALLPWQRGQGPGHARGRPRARHLPTAGRGPGRRHLDRKRPRRRRHGPRSSASRFLNPAPPRFFRISSCITPYGDQR